MKNGKNLKRNYILAWIVLAISIPVMFLIKEYLWSKYGVALNIRPSFYFVSISILFISAIITSTVNNLFKKHDICVIEGEPPEKIILSPVWAIWIRWIVAVVIIAAVFYLAISSQLSRNIPIHPTYFLLIFGFFYTCAQISAFYILTVSLIWVRVEMMFKYKKSKT